MGQPEVLVLATLATKAAETDYLLKCLSDNGIVGTAIDMSLQTDEKQLNAAGKLAAMEVAARGAAAVLSRSLSENIHAVVGLGGGTGGEIALHVLRTLPITFPKILVTTLPFDPRIAAADSAIILVPTLADICGLNATLREMLENTAALTAGLCKTRRQTDACVAETSIGVSALGATEGAVAALVNALQNRGAESTVFHANGYGGAAFTRFIKRGAFHALIDLTPHELTRIHIAGALVPMPDRFRAGRDLPRIVLPGALNFIGLGEKHLIPPSYLLRPHYEHSGYFTHAKITMEEMRIVAAELAGCLNACTGPPTLIVPMGGFSHEDRPGGAIEDPELRQVFLQTMREQINPKVSLQILPYHINAPEVTEAILAALP